MRYSSFFFVGIFIKNNGTWFMKHGGNSSHLLKIVNVVIIVFQGCDFKGMLEIFFFKKMK